MSYLVFLFSIVHNYCSISLRKLSHVLSYLVLLFLVVRECHDQRRLDWRCPTGYRTPPSAAGPRPPGTDVFQVVTWSRETILSSPSNSRTHFRGRGAKSIHQHWVSSLWSVTSSLRNKTIHFMHSQGIPQSEVVEIKCVLF